MTADKYDIVVIGTGPGGEGAAMQSIKQGKSVAVVERATQIGGNCTHRGTIPSKALRTSIYQLTAARDNPVLKEMGVTMNVPFYKLRESAAAVIARQVNMREGFYTRNNVDLILGHARFVDTHCHRSARANRSISDCESGCVYYCNRKSSASPRRY